MHLPFVHCCSSTLALLFWSSACGRIGFEVTDDVRSEPSDAADSDGSGEGRDAGTSAPGDAGIATDSTDAGRILAGCATDCVCETYDDHRYMFCDRPLPHGDASQLCQRYGMLLARIDSYAENQFLRRRTTQLDLEEPWLGGSDESTEGEWRWADGQLYWQGNLGGFAPDGLYTAWSFDEPNDQDGEDCLELVNLGDPGDDAWNDEDCENPQDFICEQYAPGQRVCGDGRNNSTLGEVCDSGGSSDTCSANCHPIACDAACACDFFDGHQYMWCTEESDFHSAAQNCRDHGMRLARIDDLEEQNWLASLMKEAMVSESWIGGHALADENRWIWQDGEQFWQGDSTGAPTNGLYSAFEADEPNNDVADEDCLEFRIRDPDNWNDQECQKPRGYLCEDYALPGANCGDGTVDDGEACDDAGASRSCDADCTIVVCGDGVVNQAAGEECDPLWNSNCNKDCTCGKKGCSNGK